MSDQATPLKWTEAMICRALTRQVFENRSVVIVPNCSWTGHECDILVVEKSLRIIDVEIKISRSDLKADLRKDKWWSRPYNWWFLLGDRPGPPAPDVRLEWPNKVWKHFYAMPKSIWTDDLYDKIPETSGVLLLRDPQPGSDLDLVIDMIRRPKPQKDAARLEPREVIDVARLASMRLWDTMRKLDTAKGGV